MKDEVVNEFAKSLLSVKRDLHFAVFAETLQKEIPVRSAVTLHEIKARS